MTEVVRGLEAAIHSHSGVLIQGEPGTGCEEMARAIHHGSASAYDGSAETLLRLAMRADLCPRDYVVVDCRERQAVEQYLFGVAGGDAANGVIGEGCALHQSLDGTLVLREVTELPARLQTRLARILRDDEVRVVGDAGAGTVIRVKVRPIATTTDDAGDLIVPELHRKVAHTMIRMPPLRHRREDIPGLIHCLLVDACAMHRVATKSVSAQSVELLTALPWYGNLDELCDVVRRLVRRVPDRLIRLSDVLAEVSLDRDAITAARYDGLTLKEARERFERDYLTAALEHHRGRMSDTAKALGIQRTNLYRKVRRLSVARRRSGTKK